MSAHPEYWLYFAIGCIPSCAIVWIVLHDAVWPWLAERWFEFRAPSRGWTVVRRPNGSVTFTQDKSV